MEVQVNLGSETFDPKVSGSLVNLFSDAIVFTHGIG